MIILVLIIKIPAKRLKSRREFFKFFNISMPAGKNLNSYTKEFKIIRSKNLY